MVLQIPDILRVPIFDERGKMQRAWQRFFIDLKREVDTLSANAITLLDSETVNLQHGDAKTVVYTVPAGKTAVITHVVIRSPSGSLAGGTDFDIGSGDDADTWRQTIDLSSMVATDDYMVIPPVAATPVKYTLEAAAAEIGIRPIIGATADETATMDVFGYLQEAA